MYPADVPLIGGRRFWVFRSFVLPQAVDARAKLISATFAALNDECDPSRGGPVGLCVLVRPEEAARRPEAVWEEPRMLYAGYEPDNRQVRIGYFEGAGIGRG